MNNLKSAFRFTLVFCLLLSTSLTFCAQAQHDGQPALFNQAALNQSGQILRDVPEKIDPKARYLFYLHGLIIENEGVRPTSPRFGVYEYQEILETFRNRNFTVISEPRPKGTDPEKYAAKVVGQINALLKAGVPPQQITIVGASRGAGIAIITSTLLKNRQVKFVIMAGCGDWEVYKKVGVDLWGRILSIYDANDDMAGTCADFFRRSTGLSKQKEVVLQLGLGHGILYRPFKEWVDLVTEWALSS